MSLCRHGLCRGLVRRYALPETRSESIWITDDLLEHTIRSFVAMRQQRRRSSNAPRPLETGNQATQRRAVDWHASSGHAFPLDTGDVSNRVVAAGDGHNKHIGTSWRSSTDWQSMLPEWRTQEAKTADTEDGLMLPDSPYLTDPVTKGQYLAVRQLKRITRNATSLDQVRDGLRRLEVNSRYKPLVSRMTFALLLSFGRRQGNFTISDFHAYLSDPDLSPETSNNFSLLFYDMTHCAVDKDTVFHHLRYTRSALREGRVSAEEVSSIIRCIPNIRISEDASLAEDPKALGSAFEFVAKGVQKSPSLGLRDLKEVVIVDWFWALRLAAPTWPTLHLVRDLLKTVPPISLNLRTLSILLSQRVYEDFRVIENAVSGHMHDFHLEYLKSLSPILCRQHVVQLITEVSETIALDPRFSVPRQCTMHGWELVMSKLNTDIFFVPRNVWSDPGDRNPFGNRDGESSPEQLFVHLWVATAIDSTTFSRIASRYRKNALDVLLASIEKANGKETKQVEVLLRLQLLSEELELGDSPATTRLIEYAANLEYTKAKHRLRAWMRSCRFIEEPQHDDEDRESREPTRKLYALQQAVIERLRAEADNLVQGLSEYLDGPHSIDDMLRNYAYYTRTRHSSEISFTKLAQVVDVVDAGTVEQLIMLGLAGPITRSVLFRLLGRHAPLKRAIAAASRKLQPPRSSHDPEAYLNTLHALAVTFSCAPHLSSAESWRLVNRIHRFIKIHDGPIRPIMARALVQAGIHRSLGEDKLPPLPRWGLASRTAGNLNGGDEEYNINKQVIEKARELEERERRLEEEQEG